MTKGQKFSRYSGAKSRKCNEVKLAGAPVGYAEYRYTCDSADVTFNPFLEHRI